MIAGSSPVMISKKLLEPISEVWFNVSFEIKKDPEADRAWGWVQEMYVSKHTILTNAIVLTVKFYSSHRYAWSIASAIVPGGPTAYSIRPEFMVQPPWDEDVKVNGKTAALIHYTYSNDFDADGEPTPAIIGKWHFDKRDYMVG